MLLIEVDGVVAGGVRWALINRRTRIADVGTLMLDPAFRGCGLATLCAALLWTLAVLALAAAALAQTSERRSSRPDVLAHADLAAMRSASAQPT